MTDKGESGQVEPDSKLLAGADEPDEPEAGGSPGAGRGGGTGSRFDPMSIFTRLDANKDGKVTAKELEGNRMADRLKTLDKDKDGEISKEEFRTGISSLFSRRGNYARQDNRPERPQRPAPSP